MHFLRAACCLVCQASSLWDWSGVCLAARARIGGRSGRLTVKGILAGIHTHTTMLHALSLLALLS